MTDTSFVIVPKNPMPEMLGAWYRYKSGFHWPDEPVPPDTSDYGAYAAMIAASPPPVSLEEIVEALEALLANLDRIPYRDGAGLRATATPQFEAARSLLSRLKGMDNPEGK